MYSTGVIRVILHIKLGMALYNELKITWLALDLPQRSLLLSETTDAAGASPF